MTAAENAVLSLSARSNQEGHSYKAFPDSLDWRTKGVITPVTDYSDSPHVAGVVMVGK